MSPGLILLGVVLVVPLLSLYLVNPVRWRKRPVPAEAKPFRNRAFSAFKRATWAWVVGMLALLAAAAVLAVISRPLPFRPFFRAVPVAVLLAAAWGAIWPRTYADRVDRVRNHARLGWLLLTFWLLVVYAPVCACGSMIAQSGLGFFRSGGKAKQYHVTAERYAASKFAFADPIAGKLIPKDATDIVFDFRFGLGLGLGSSGSLKCRVSREGLDRFAKENDYEFRSDSFVKNACAEGCGDCDFIHDVFNQYNPPRPTTAWYVIEKGSDGKERRIPGQEFVPYPKKFLAYNYRYNTCGGYSFFYDIEKETLYASWDSN